ncbi:MAG TPA: flagellar basal-body MS-ring/collar protein FliF [Longimicrobiales bacterium]|nr:flagellar basal-body MS-ring/collar protein FliF [Longimicrobiales bacterium]
MPETLRAVVERVGGERRMLVLVVGAAAILAVLGFARWASAPAWVPLFPGMALERVAEVTPKLDDAGIAYRLDKGGSEIQVHDSELAKARVLLAKDGYPSKGRPGFELFDQPSWGMTDFTQRVNYRRALEGELERTISQMRGIQGAQVHLALQEATPFRDERRPEQASVVVRTRGGARPEADVVEGIASLVASSVDGLESDNVAVLDDAGHLLSGGQPGSSEGLTKRQLALRREVESYLEQKTEELVGQVVGAGNVRVRVAAALNFDRVESTIQSVDPDAQVATREEKTEITPGPNTPGAASTATSATYDVTRKTETTSGGVGSIKRLTVAVLLNDKPAAKKGGASQPRTADELSRVDALVRNAVGIDTTRGDAISVVSIPFTAAPAEAPAAAEKPDLLTRTKDFQRPALMALGILLAFVIAWRALGSLRPVQVAAPVAGAAAELGAGGAAAALEPERVVPALAAPTRRQIAFAAEQPDMAARVIRAWMKD